MERKRPNHTLRRERELKGWSQQMLAEKLETNEQAVNRWENGVHKPNRYFQTRLCQIFEKTAEELGFMNVSQKSKSGELTVEDKHVLPPVQTDSIPVPYSSLQSLLKTLENFIVFSCTALVLSYQSYTTTSDSDENDTLSSIMLIEMEHITVSYWRLCTNTSLNILGNVAEHFQTLACLLKQTHSRKVANLICSLLGETAQILGKILFDLHEYNLSQSYYIFSLKSAQTASNHDLWAVGLGRLILLLIYQEQSKKALPLIQEIQQLAIQNNLVASWLLAVQAEVYASLGEDDLCEAALRNAKSLFLKETPGEDSYAIGFNLSRLAGYEGACFLRLRKPEHAVAPLQEALILLEPQAIRRRSTILTDTGIAQAQQGKIEEACESAKQALLITLQTKSVVGLERVRLIYQELEEWKENIMVVELKNLIENTFRRITAQETL